MGIFGSIGKALKGVGKIAGKGLQIAAPFAGLIPGVGIPAAAALGAGGKFLGKALSGEKADLGSALASGAAAGGTSALTGGQGFKGFGNVLPKLGQIAQNPNLGKIVGAGGAVANTVGGIQQRQANQKALQSSTDLRNQLLSRILSGNQQTYNFGH